MTKAELVEIINQDITISGSMDLNVSKKEIERIVEQEKRYAYRK